MSRQVSPGPLLRALARLLVHGSAAQFIRGDLDEGFRRDVTRGLSVGRARVRFVVNVFASALTLAGSSIARRRSPAVLPSLIDLKLGWRILGKSPLLTSVAVLSLAIGIPVGMAPVHLLDAFSAPPPVEGGDRLMGLRFWETGSVGVPVTSYDLAMWQETLKSYEGLAAFRPVERNLAVAGGDALPVSAAEMTAEAFSVLRSRPALGRALQEADEAPGAARVVVIGFDIWQSRFASASDVIGATVRVGGVAHTVVGVMPEGFYFPIRQSMWLPLRDRPAAGPEQGRALLAFGRLAHGVTPDEAQTEFSAVHARMAAQFPERYGKVAAEVVPVTTMLSNWPRGGLGSMQALGPLSVLAMFQLAALALLAVACANVGLLIFARTATRTAELVTRTALGASRARLVGQVATEALVLALIAAGVGLLLMDWVPNRMLALLWSGAMPWWIDLGLTPVTVVRALVLAALSATLAAVFPALRVTGKALRSRMQRDSSGYGVRFGGVWSVLVVADVTFALAALGLILGTGSRMQTIAAGESEGGVPVHEYLSVQMDMPESERGAAADSAEMAAWRAQLASAQRRLVERLEAEPGVRGVTVGDALPRMDHGSGRIEVEGGVAEGIERANVAPNYFSVLGQSMRAGRDFHGGDVEGARSAVIVNETFAAELLGGANPVGRRVRYLSWPEREPGPWHEIVGMVADLGMDPLQPQNAAGIYHPIAPGDIATPYLAVHLAMDPAAFVPRVRQIAEEVEPAAIVRAMPLDKVYPDDWYAAVRFTITFSVFVAVLLTLAATGIYAIMAFTVAQRTREIGIRTALGARTTDIVASIGRRAAIQLATGALIGMPIAGWIYFQLRSDPTATMDAFLVAVIPGLVVVLVVGLLACTVPLLRALRVMPTEALKGG